MFASKTVKEIVVKDGATDVTVTYRKLSRRQLHEASELQSDAAAKHMNRIGAEVLRGLQDAAREEDRRRKEVAKDAKGKIAPANYSGYDVDYVLTAGIVKWTATVEPKLGIADLDEEVSNKIFKAIIDISVDRTEATEAPKD